MKELRISPDISLPIDAVTQTFGILAKKGAGKSNAGVVMAEEMWKVGVPWVAIDAKGDWWGMRSSADGKHAGLPLVVFGGRHGDIPLEVTAGRMLADLILANRLTCILDVSEFSKADLTRFLTDFGDRLYRQATDEPLHLFLEEAHEYLPQMVRNEESRCVGVWQKIVKWGRTKGLGVTLISQRSASLNKDVLTQVDTLVVLRTTSPQDRAAVKAWVDVHEASVEMMHDLPSLINGEAWLWSPEFLGKLVKIRFRQRETFDSGATPKVGETRRPPATLADVDLGAIKEAMAETIEAAKADDPKELRKLIKELERQLAAKPVPVAEPVIEVREVEVVREVAVLPPGFDKAVELLRSRLDETLRLSDTAVDEFTVLVNDLRNVAQPAGIRVDKPVDKKPPTIVVQPSRPAPQPRPSLDTTSFTSMTGPQRKLLTVLATYGPRTHKQLAMQSGYTNSGSFRNIISQLRKADWAEGTSASMFITDTGRGALGEYEELPAGPALLQHWLDQIPGPHARLLDELARHYPNAMESDELAARTGYTNSGSFRNLISKLRTRGLVAPGQPLRLADEFGEAIQ